MLKSISISQYTVALLSSCLATCITSDKTARFAQLFPATRMKLQGALQVIFHDGFWKSEHDFLIVFHSNFLSGMHSFRYNEVLLPNGYGVIVSPLPGVVARIFSWRILKERPWLTKSVPYSNFLSMMHGFRDIKVSLPTGYDVNETVPLRRVALSERA